jgi:protein involved in polysaccharide export with SLBB domain
MGGTFHWGDCVSFIRFAVPVLFLALAAPQRGAWGQGVENPSAKTTREQIQAAIAEAEKIANSGGYSQRIRLAKRQEIAVLRARLTEGDLQPGDQVILSVQNEKDLTGIFAVSGGRFITLPGVADISLKGVLRSELQDYLTNELRKYIKDPVVHVRTTVRLSILGAVGKPGFYQIPSEAMIGDAIMVAGGPSGAIDPAKTRVARNGEEVMSREAFSEAVSQGRTLDQMNLQAGDEILVGGTRTPTAGRAFLTVGLPVLTGVASLGWLMVQIF